MLISRTDGLQRVHADAPQRLFVTGSLTGSFRSFLGAFRRSFGWSLSRFDFDLGFIGQSVRANGDHLVVGRDSIHDLHVIAIADSQLDRLLMSPAISTREHD